MRFLLTDHLNTEALSNVDKFESCGVRIPRADALWSQRGSERETFGLEHLHEQEP